MGGCPPRSGTAPETSRPTEMREALAQLLAHLATKADTGMGLAAKLELLPQRGRSQARTACSPPPRGGPSTEDHRGQSLEAAVGLPGLLLHAPKFL